ncbi:dihydrodipicolinate synthase family protein, partial [Sinomonas sp. G460-2]|uniref:dihydrodipicolinate synthase family protein n=1 Tax=Sinomonas sp. G460-2 TaxID=3393464 RepID=UPI0039EF4B0E
MNFDGILFFPVTPFDAEGRVDPGLAREHVASRLPYGPGGVFAACGTGEYHALTAQEAGVVVRS